MSDPIIIVGAGLSGLYTASLLVSRGIDCRVLEARGRIGGRVLSREVPEQPELGKFDLGPTWFWPQYESVISSLVEKLNLKAFDQHTKGAVLLEQSQNGPIQRYLPPEGTIQRSVRLSEGIQSLIAAIAGTLPPGIIELDTRVTAVHKDKKGMITLQADHNNGKDKRIHASAVIFALPPRVVAHHIKFLPSLPNSLLLSMNNKPTWMAGQAKAVVIYNRPFWRDDGLSGQAMSWSGPLQEIHDASSNTGYGGALFGFFGLHAKKRKQLGKEKLLKLTLYQLTRLFGPLAEKPISVLYKDWYSDPETALEDDTNTLQSYANYGRIRRSGEGEKRIAFAGTETSSEFGGHLEGALRSAKYAVTEILECDKTQL